MAGLSVLLLLSDATQAQGKDRIALVIGNANYEGGIFGSLEGNDAEDMAAALERCGFSVTRMLDAGRREMVRAIRTFGHKMGRGKVALFYYSGHGVQVGGESYLAPVDTQAVYEDEVESECVKTRLVLGKMDNAKNDMNIIVVDACRNNALKGHHKGGSQDVKMPVPTGSVIAYATAFGEGAKPATMLGRNSLYTSVLLKHMETPELRILDLFMRVRREMLETYGEEQIPWERMSLTRNFYFVKGKKHKNIEQLPHLTLMFDYNKSAIRARYHQMLDEMAETLKQNPQLNLEIQGHTCNTGSHESRFAVSERRSKAVRNYFIKKGIFAERLRWEGYGKLRPIASNDTEGGRRLNRRVEVHPVYSAGTTTIRPDTTTTSILPYSTTTIPQRTGEWREPVTGMAFVWVPGGCFQMGQTEAGKRQIIKDLGKEEYDRFYAADELPRHEVCVDGFWMGKHEVTNAQYRQFKSGHDSGDQHGYSLNGRNQPVVEVSWEDTKAFAKWLARQNGGRNEFRLPTEAEWEYACRAGTRTERFLGYDSSVDACNKYAKVDCGDGIIATSPVGSFRANSFGLHDLLGNVWEWCDNRVDRGGSWCDPPASASCASRRRYSRHRSNCLGFRFVRTH